MRALFNSKIYFFILWLFLLVFPKGGFKIGPVPVTWGYLFLGLFSFVLLFRTKWQLNLTRFYSYLCTIPFQIVAFYTLAVAGIVNYGMAISLLVSFVFFPLAFFLLFSHDIEHLDLRKFAELFKKGVFFVAAYGIFLFFYKILLGHFFEIPFLTTNWGDLGELDTKCNNRGGVFKLISTYNNGNIFGICVLILLPLYCYFEQRNWRKLLVKFALFLTLSRTVWLGLLFHELCYDFFLVKNAKKFLLKIGLVLLSFTLLFAIFAFTFGFSLDFLFDTELGGRAEQFDFLGSAGLLAHKPFDAITEIIYLGILDSFGYLGLICFLLAMVGPVVLNLYKYKSPFHLVILLGCTNYLFIACSDGALLFLPTMAFYWFLNSLLARKTAPLHAVA